MSEAVTKQVNGKQLLLYFHTEVQEEIRDFGTKEAELLLPPVVSLCVKVHIFSLGFGIGSI